MKTIAALAAVAWLAGAGPAAAIEVGQVARTSGVCRATEPEPSRDLQPRAPVSLGEVLATGEDARLEIGFDDRTTLTLGENAQIRIDSFVYAPANSRKTIRLATVGAFRFVSGAGGRAFSADAVVATPVATIGVRGTDFWAGPIDGAYGVLLLDGAVEVTNAGGTATLDEPGEGVNIVGAGAAPGAVTQWPQDKVSRALAAVAFP